MKTHAASKSNIKVASKEQQENAKNTRKTLKVLQETADKENLVGRSGVKSNKLTGDENLESKRKKLVHKSVQTDEATVTVHDLTSTEEPSEAYWRLLAETREQALNDSLQENETLKEHIETLENENRIIKELLDESKCLVETLQEMIDDDDTEEV